MAELEEGRVIGSYRVVRCIGQGGMGTVYEVEHVELGVRYALKTFSFDPNASHATALKTKFLEEGKVLARLKHPNIAHVFDLAFDEATQMPYFVMDLVTYEDGEAYTAEDVEPTDIDEELVLQWFTEVAAALDYIHGEGIVHRDVKPGNLLLGKGEHVVLTDFGISRVFGKKMQQGVHAEKTIMTTTGRGKVVMGTEKYMAPEVAQGEEATPAADAYALGVMLLRWLTGFYYSDNPGCIALLAHKKYKWLPVVAQLIAPASRRPDNLSVLVKRVKVSGEGEQRRDTPREKKRKRRNEWLRAFLIAFFVLAGLCGVVAFVILASQLLTRDGNKVAHHPYPTNTNVTVLSPIGANETNEPPENVVEPVETTDPGKTEPKPIEVVVPPVTPGDKPGNGEQPPNKPNGGKKEENREFVVDTNETVKAVKDYGPIPDRKYKWLRGGDADAPMQEHFLLANGATIELMPFKRTTFSMTNEEGDPKGWHEVTLTRPFWMSKSCVTVDQWREFAPNDCDDCRDVEKSLGGKALLYLKISRKAIDEYCVYLTAKYRIKLPKGYVFRLPSEAEWEYVMDNEAVVDKYHKPGVKDWSTFVGIQGETFMARFVELRKNMGKGALDQFDQSGWKDNYKVGGLSMPLPSGVFDMYGWDRLTLDVYEISENQAYKPIRRYWDHEVDPLSWCKNVYNDRLSRVLVRDWATGRKWRGFREPRLCHIVVGPDLIAERAWANKRENVGVKANVPRQAKKFDVKKIPNKISKPREITLKRVGGIETVFCEIPKGKFNMSNVDGQAKQYHKVELTRPFWMSKFLVTSAEWREYAPNDFKTRAVKAAERLFPKNPVCVNNPYHRWTAYCEFLNKRYGHLLPQGYVFRLPTEAEWEWAFIADEKGDVRRMGDEYCTDNDRMRNEFVMAMKKLKAPKELRYDTLGTIGCAYIGGRSHMSGFGVLDLAVHRGSYVMMLDNFDTQGWLEKDGVSVCWWGASPAQNIIYKEKEVDPVRYGGQYADFVLKRGLRAVRDLRHKRSNCEYAHIVIAPDILKPLKEKEVAEFPMEDFGGTFLGDGVTKADQSSKQTNGAWNDDKHFKRMVSRENVIVAKFDKGEDTRGFHTTREDAPWIQLNLGKRRKVTGLAIDGFLGNTRKLCVWVSNDGKHEKLVAKEDLERKRYRIDLQKKDVMCQYIRIGREPSAQKNLWFYLDKIVIYGK